jgi:hypothetical protein
MVASAAMTGSENEDQFEGSRTITIEELKSGRTKTVLRDPRENLILVGPFLVALSRRLQMACARFVGTQTLARKSKEAEKEEPKP